MTAGAYDVTLEQGADLALVFTWKDESGTAINLTGYTARLHMREKIADTNPFLTLTTGNGGITLGGAAGTITLAATAAATAAVKAAGGVYDLELISSGGTVTRLLAGKVVVSKEVTR